MFRLKQEVNPHHADRSIESVKELTTVLWKQKVYTL